MNLGSKNTDRGNRESLALGFDAGSVALKTVVADVAGRILDTTYTRTNGRPLATARRVLGELLERFPESRFSLVAGTGAAGRLISDWLGAVFLNEVICQAVAGRRLAPQARMLLEIGGQDSKLIILPKPGSNGQDMLDFTMNTSCAAGTGSFLDQQASRLGVRIEEEFGCMALRSRLPARVAGRCSVFAKTDMIHLQQQATPTEDIVAGLCLGLARNLKSNLGQGHDWEGPIVFCGGVASNQGVVRTVREVLELGPDDLIVPDEHAVTGALGAILVTLRERAERGPDYGRPPAEQLDLHALDRSLRQGNGAAHRLEPLTAPAEPGNAAAERGARPNDTATGLADGYLGLDVGSISTKAAVIDSENRLLAKSYQMTAGRPLDAVRRVLAAIREQLGERVRIRGAATTGSGRYLTGDFIGADLVINEITAQATAAAEADPSVDTVFEIGGQDSKYISLDRGVVVDFEMNHACAAGTGSFLEEQAERLGIRINEEFGRMALSSQSPVRLGERCTVFMESDLLSHQQRGEAAEDLVAGLCYSIVGNYLSRVVGNRRIGERVFFQGATAFNQGVVAAFRKVTGLDITVPPNHEVTGAIGAAVLVRRNQQQRGDPESRFAGFALADLECSVRSFACDACSNHCEVNEVTIPQRSPLYHGSRCDRYNIKKESARPARAIPDLFAERQQLLMGHAHLPEPRPGRPNIGIPLALSNYELLPFWGTLLSDLGFNVVVSPPSNSKIIRRGVEAVLSTPCFPVKVAHGHVLELIDQGVDFLWIPSVVSMWRDGAGQRFNQLCPYVTSIPYQIAAAVDPEARGVPLLKPPVSFEDGPAGLVRQLTAVGRRLGASGRRLRKAVRRAWRAQEQFGAACLARGREVLEGLSPGQRAVVVVSRPYNGCDCGLHLDLPGKLRQLDVLAIPVDFLELEQAQPRTDRVFQEMYWKYGQRILRAAEWIRSDPRLSAIFLSNFGCGPDSFIQEYFYRLMAPKPALVLEIDEHSAGAGVVTRLEAFLESLRAAKPTELPAPRRLAPPSQDNLKNRVVFVPWMGDQSHTLAATFRAYGQAAEVMPTADPAGLDLGRRACGGKQCLPCLITAGDLIQTTRRPDFDPQKAAFFMPGGSGPCRFGQYNCLHKLVLDDLGLSEVPILSPSHDTEFYDHCRELGRDALLQAWRGNCAADLLERALAAIRPYETRTGHTDEVYRRCRDRLMALVERRPSLPQLVEEVGRAAAEFQAIPTDRGRWRPRIGIVGEAYVRFHSFANNDLVRWLERLGAETIRPGLPEWMYYTNWTRRIRAWRERRLRPWLTARITDAVMWRAHRRLAAPFAPVLGSFDEPHPRELFALAAPYLDPTFQGEAIITIGKMLEYQRQGCHGVINVMPFSCMPSTIVAGLIKQRKGPLGQMPSLTLSFDGQQDPAMETRLAAFVHQARALRQKGVSGGVRVEPD